MQFSNPSITVVKRVCGGQYTSIHRTRFGSPRRTTIIRQQEKSRLLHSGALFMYSLFAILYSSGRVSSLLHQSLTRRIGYSAVKRRRSFYCRRTPFLSVLDKPTSTRCFASLSSNDEIKKRKDGKKKKWKVNESAGQENADKLAAAFAELAQKEGFDDSMSRYADHDTFEDDFVEDFDYSDQGPPDRKRPDDNDDMDARIAAAQLELDTGRISIPRELDEFASEVTEEQLRRLGFKREMNPFGDDETPRKNQFKLITDAMVCSACGADFQGVDEKKPGYLPPEKFEIRQKLAKIEEAQKVKQKAESKEWSSEDEIEWLIRTSGTKAGNDDEEDIDIDAMAKEMGLDLAEHANKKVVCKRCHGLQNFGTVDDFLRPGWTKEPLLSQERFRDLLRPIREKPAVIIALVDLFDFSGSVLPQLDAIAGDNPVIFAGNKADLLPSSMGRNRAENWVRRELEYLGIRSLANVGGAVQLISCKTGIGVGFMLSKARKLAEEMKCDIYVVGAANAGKSTLINFILDKDKGLTREKTRPGKALARKGELTTSPLPGTTLKFIKIDIGQGINLYDTPGLLVPGTLTQLLTPEELKVVVPKKQVEHITFRVPSGKCVLIGGLARIEIVGDCKPFFLTFFVANGIKLHVTDINKADDFLAKHVGGLIHPPSDPERMEQIGALETHTVQIKGAGWKEAAADIALTGLGWVAVTGAGTANVQIRVPKGIGVSVRPPLMPFDAMKVASKYTGAKATRKSSKRRGKRRSGVGRN